MRAVSIAAVLLLAACSGASLPSSSPALPTAPAPTSRSTATPGPTAPASSPAASATPAPTTASDGWRELGSGMWLEGEVFAAAAAASQPQLDELWQRLGQTTPVPVVDFERELVLFLGMSGSSSCPERLERLIVDHASARVFGQWAGQDPGQPCTDDLQAQGVLLAVDRSMLPDGQFLLSLREQPICPECEDRPDQVVVDPAA